MKINFSIVNYFKKWKINIKFNKHKYDFLET